VAGYLATCYVTNQEAMTVVRRVIVRRFARVKT
jgi:hypothetical protein